METAPKCNRRNLTNINALKLKKTKNELANMYLKEQTEYIQNQFNKIRDSVEDRQYFGICSVLNCDSNLYFLSILCLCYITHTLLQSMVVCA